MTGRASASSAPTTAMRDLGEREERQAVQLAAAHRRSSRRLPGHQVLPRRGLRPPLRPDHRDLPEHGGPLPRPGQLQPPRRARPAGRPIARLDVDPSADDLVVVGWGLGHLAGGGPWTQGHGYAWQRADLEGHRVLYLGYLHSIWGDAAGRVVSRLAAARRTPRGVRGQGRITGPGDRPQHLPGHRQQQHRLRQPGHLAGLLRRQRRRPAGHPLRGSRDLPVGPARRQDLAGRAGREPVRGPRDRPYGTSGAQLLASSSGSCTSSRTTWPADLSRRPVQRTVQHRRRAPGTAARPHQRDHPAPAAGSIGRYRSATGRHP